MNGDVADYVVDDAVGIFYMINPVMARKRLDRVNVWAGDVAAGIVNLHKKGFLIRSGLMMPVATSRRMMRLVRAKALSP